MDIRHIARSVIDTEINDYYWTVINDIWDAYETRMKVEGIDSDDRSKAREYCENIFKKVTGVTIYEALGKAYGYVAKTIAYKVDKKDMYERIVSNYIHKKNKNLTKEEMDVVYEENYVRIVLKNAKRPPIIPENEGYGLSEDDINKINKIIIDRTKKIYGDRTISDISPALRKIYDHLEERKENMASISKISKCETMKTQHESDAETIRNGFKDIVKIYDDQGCTNICYEVNLDNGHKWAIRFEKLWVGDIQIRGE